jgi:hypothetical protein
MKMKKFGKKNKKIYRAIYYSMIELGKSQAYAYQKAMRYMNMRKKKYK